jgi:hypothetical protein
MRLGAVFFRGKHFPLWPPPHLGVGEGEQVAVFRGGHISGYLNGRADASIGLT